MKIIPTLTTVTAALVAAGVWAVPASAQYYKGKTITLVVGFASGGTDQAARVLAKNIKKYIPGEPNVIVRNQPGAASIKAQNFIFERAKPDGLTIGFNPFQVMAQISQGAGIRFKYEDFTFIAGVKAAAFMAMARADVVPGGLKSAEDLFKAKGLKYTGRNPIHSIDVMVTGAFDLLGVPYSYVPGYRGGGAIMTSLARGETTFTGSGLNMWANNAKQYRDKGILVPLWQHRFKDPKGGFTTIPPYDGIPTFVEVYKKIKGKDPSGPLWDAYRFAEDLMGTANFIVAGPPNMNPEAAKILRAAFAKVVEAPETEEMGKRLIGMGWRHVGFEQAKPVLDKLRNPDPAVVKFWQNRIAEYRLKGSANAKKKKKAKKN